MEEPRTDYDPDGVGRQGNTPAVEGQQPARFQFGVFELNCYTRELRKHGVKLKLQEQPLQVLLILLENPGEIITREEIQSRLWPQNTYVDFDNAINSAMRKLRDALGDSADSPRFIETQARRGYRFIAPVNCPAPREPARQPGKQLKSGRFPIHKPVWAVLAATLFLLTGSAFFARWYSESHAGSDALPPPVPLTSYPGYQWSPSFSPDGTRVAFTWEEPGKNTSAVYAKLMGPTDPVRLAASEEGDFAPAWSPDGRWIAFLRAKGPFSAAVMLIPSLGGSVRELARLQVHVSRFVSYGMSGMSPPFLAWSPDNKWLLALEQNEPEGPAREARINIVRVAVDSGEKHPFVLSLDAEAKQHNQTAPLMTGEAGLAVSPDGKQLAFIHAIDGPNTALYVVALTDDMLPAAHATSLHFDRSLCTGIAWDADGRTLIVSSNRRGPFELWRVPVNPAREPSRLNASADLPADVAVSKTGQRLAYTHLAYDWNIWRVDLTNNHLKNPEPFITSTRDERNPSYSPDGKRVAFESNRFGNEEILVSDADGSHPVQLTSFGNSWAGSPSWSPDGHSIAFDGDGAGQWDIYLVPSQGGKPTRFTTGSGSKIRPSWSLDGKWIYYCASGDSGPQIWKKAAAGAAEVQITKYGGCNQMESPDGRFVYYLNATNSTLFSVPVAGGDERRVTELGPEGKFVLGKYGVYFGSPIDGNTLKFLSYGSSSIKVMGKLSGTLSHGLTLSPDEHWLLYARSDAAGSQLMVIEDFR